MKQETLEEREKRLIKESLTILPKNYVKLHPKHTFEFQIRYCPTETMRTFTEKVAFQVHNTVETLCIVKGCCLDVNYYLDRNFVDFGNVIFGYKMNQKLIMYNAGDIGGRWEISFTETSKRASHIFSYTDTSGRLKNQIMSSKYSQWKGIHPHTQKSCSTSLLKRLSYINRTKHKFVTQKFFVLTVF